MRWNIYDDKGNWIGTADGASENEAIENAKKDGMAADRAEARSEARD